MALTQFNTPEEDALIKAASKGDKDAFGRIVSMYERLVYNTVKQKVGSAEDAFDLSQEVFIKLWRSIGRYRGDCRFSTWVYKVCINASLDFLRKAQTGAVEQLPVYTDKDGDELSFEPADDSVTSSPERSCEQNEAVRMVRDGISRLSPEQREVILLRDIEGYTYEEISEMLRLEIGTVKSRLNRARCNLRQIIEKTRSGQRIIDE